METADSEAGNVPALEINSLRKVYSKAIVAVDDVSLSVAQGEIFGLLGPNGAGKSTIIKTVMTLSKPDRGSVAVLGTDALKHRSKARQSLGYVPQEVSVDGDLTGYENLLIFAKLYGVGRAGRETRIHEALKTMGLEERGDDLVKTYSGGMMRRLEIAQALVNRPKVLFLDEPSIGLDPVARHEVWDRIQQLRKALAATIFITTHDMLEAERLCDRLAILDRGKVVAVGTPDELKSAVGGEMLIVKLAEGAEAAEASSVKFPAEIGARVMRESPAGAGGEIAIVVNTRAEEAAPRVAAAFERAGLALQSLSVSRPTLDDVFLLHTKMRIVEAETYRRARSTRRNFKKHAK